MRTRKMLNLLAVPIAAFLAIGSHCPLIPEIEERVVELAVGGSTTVQFHAQGSINYEINETESADIHADLDIVGLIEDAGVDVNDVKAIKVAGVSYRMVSPDASIDRQIQGGTVTCGRGPGPVTASTPLVTNFTEGVNFVTTYKTAPVDAAGIGLMNDLLADILAEAQTGVPATNPVITYTINGISSPTDEPTDFIWEVKVDITILGTVTVDVVD